MNINAISRRFPAFLVLIVFGPVILSCGPSVRSQYDARLYACNDKHGAEKVRCFKDHPVATEPADCRIYDQDGHRWSEYAAIGAADSGPKPPFFVGKAIEDSDKARGQWPIISLQCVASVEESDARARQALTDERASTEAANLERERKAEGLQSAAESVRAAKTQSEELAGRSAVREYQAIVESAQNECGERWLRTSTKCDDDAKFTAEALAISAWLQKREVDLGGVTALGDTRAASVLWAMKTRCRDACRAAAEMALEASLMDCKSDGKKACAPKSFDLGGQVQDGNDKKVVRLDHFDVAPGNSMLQECATACKKAGTDARQKARVEAIQSRYSICLDKAIERTRDGFKNDYGVEWTRTRACCAQLGGVFRVERINHHNILLPEFHCVAAGEELSE